MKKVILFDFDGVIVSSCKLSYQINLKDSPNLQYSEWQSWFDGNIFKSIRTELQNDKYQDHFFHEYNSKIGEIEPIRGIKNVITKLALDYKLIIVSSSSFEAIESYLTKYDLRHFFDKVLAREAHESKVEKFKYIKDLYNVEFDDCLIVTDTLGDIGEANEVGMESVGVTWGAHNREKLSLGLPLAIVDKPEEITMVI